MWNDQNITLYGPAILIIAALIWGFARILYLSITSNVAVLAFIAQRKTPPEIGLALVAITLDGYLLARPLYPQLDVILHSQPSAYAIIGIIIMVFGVALAILSQVDMGKAWRIGVPPAKEETQQLITSGLYAFSRNPIYLGIMLFLAGGLVALPGPLTLISLIVTALLVQRIIQREEAFMQQSFGDEYNDYCERVHRWL